jgi:hypothetical protein
MANTNGGTIYVGLPADPKATPEGIREPQKAIETLHGAIAKRFNQAPPVQIDSLPTQGKTVVRIAVQTGPDVPYAIDQNQFYVRDEAETTLAVRDEIVRMVERGLSLRAPRPVMVEEPPAAGRAPEPTPQPRRTEPDRAQPAGNGRGYEPPRTGVEIVDSQERDGVVYHTLRDLRNGNLVNNVTRASARRLWHYAITQVETAPPDLSAAQWRHNVAVLNRRQKGNMTLYDLAVREGDRVHIYYGVTDGGLDESTLALVGEQARE